MINPLNQFIITPIFSINIYKFYIIFTNSTISFIGLYIILITILYYTLNNIYIIPSKKQAIMEITILYIEKMLISLANKKAKKFLALITSVFVFIVLSNIISMIPYMFANTSHISVTFIISIFVFAIITIVGFQINNIKYLKIFLPKNTPYFISPLMIIIELFTYISRPISLSIRLAANITAGHVVLKVVAIFSALLGYLGIIPFILLIILTGFEFFIAILQAYIFTILTCAYLNDALNLHQ